MSRKKKPGRQKGARQSQWVIGRNAVVELLRASADRIEAIHVTKAAAKAIPDLEQRCRKASISLTLGLREELSELVESDSHQGIIASVTPRQSVDPKEFLKGCPEKALCIALDAINDPHNFGAILRVAECFGAQGVFYSRNRGSSLTAVVSKTSAGASEFVSLVEVGNLATLVDWAKEAGFWVVVADSNTDATDLYTFEFPEKTLLILGSEGSGPKALLKKKADFAVKIPMCGVIDSLNVSQAAAVFLSHHQRSLLSDGEPN